MVQNPSKGIGPPTGPSPSGKSANEAAAIAGAAAAASKQSKNGSFFKIFRSKLDSHSANVRAAAEGWIAGARLGLAKAQTWQMPVKVDVDVMRPFFISIREGVDAAWARVPSPIQQRSKHIAVGLGAAWLVHAYEHGQLVMQRTEAKKVQLQLAQLIQERDKQAEVIKGLRANALAPRSASELKLAAAVAEASAAAAQASTAAALAAEAAAKSAQGCVYQHPGQGRRIPP
eukprot:jgi/Botrbrau1/13755/Bobra.0056s0012.1